VLELPLLVLPVPPPTVLMSSLLVLLDPDRKSVV
jgi:hypothetical protein